ncbi:hypothetical protein QYF36_005272 [Acer negundo]|nr:hypothetical protein QYF36_005272 [Acer negundo]
MTMRDDRIRAERPESEIRQTIVKDILNKLNDTPLSSPENTHTVDIREEDSGHEDEEAIQVPTFYNARLGFCIKYINLQIEFVVLPSVFQLSQSLLFTVF